LLLLLLLLLLAELFIWSSELVMRPG